MASSGAINSRNAWSLGHLFCACRFRPLSACAVHCVGSLRRLCDALSPRASLVARRFTCLGHSYRTAPLVVSFDCAGELARSQGGCATVPGRISAPLPGQIGLSGHLCNSPDDCRRDHLRSESCLLWPANLARSTPLAPASPLSSFLHLVWHKIPRIPGHYNNNKDMRILMFTGKGGVGKTCLAAATGIKLAALNYRTLVMSIDPAHSLGDSFDLETDLFHLQTAISSNNIRESGFTSRPLTRPGSTRSRSGLPRSNAR